MYSGFHCTGKVMHRRGLWSQPTCPRCQEDEDHNHLIQCQSDHGKQAFLEAWGNLDDWLEKTSSEEISQAIYVLITDFRSNLTELTLPYPAWTDALIRTFQLQQEAGPRSFHEGMLVNAWSNIQAQHYAAKRNNRNCPDNWVQRLIQQIHLFTHTLWKKRCHYVHDTKFQNKIYRNDYALQLRYLLQHPPPASMPATDRRHFVSLDKALTYTLRRHRRLIRQLRTYTQAHEIRMNTQNARIMRDWLATAKPD